MEFRVFLTVLIIISLAQSKEQVFEKTKDGIPKVVWSYWEQQLETAPIFTKLCLKNRDKTIKENGWKHIILTKDTLHEYIDPAEVQRYLFMSTARNLAFKADIIRLLLTMKYGGMWLDVNSYYLTDFQWMQNPNQPFIHNKLQSPDIILSAYTEGATGGNYTYITDKSGQIINLFPTYEDWMIVSKPDSKFLHDWQSIYVEACQKTKPVMDAENAQNGILMPTPLLDYYFFASNYPEQITIQRKQKQLQRQNSPQFAVDYYRVRHIEAHENAFKLFLYYNEKLFPMWADVSIYSTNDIQLGGPTPYFRKFVGFLHPTMTSFLNNYVTYNCWGLQFFVEDGSEIGESLFRQGKGEAFFWYIEELHQNLNEKDFCRRYVQKNKQILLQQSNIVAVAHWITYGLLFMLVIMILGFYHCIYCICKSDQKNSIEKY